MMFREKQQKLLPLWLFCILFSNTSMAQSSLFSADDPVTQLHFQNFSSVIHNSPKMWIIDFYAAWCGHCQRMAPEFSAMARNIQGWSDVVGVAAVACSDPANSALCRNYGVNGYPTVKFFPPNSETSFHGHHYEGDKQAASLQTAVLEYLAKFISLGKSDSSWPKLTFIRQPQELWQSSGVREVFVVVEDETMTKEHTGVKLILDSLHLRPGIVVGRMNLQTADFLGARSPGLYRSSAFGSLQELTRDPSWQRMSSLIREGSEQYVSSNPSVTQRLSPKPTPSMNNYTPQRGLHMQDLESSLYYSLWVEIPSHEVFDNETYHALKRYIDVLTKYHPGEQHIKKFLSRINQWLSTHRGQLTARSWLQKLESTQSRDAYVRENLRWTGCNGSLPHFRGYPCSLWMTFHALTVSAYAKENANVNFKPLDVLIPIRDYVKHFLGCRQCATNFGRRARHLENTTLASRDVVLWLWKSHNRANSHLHGDATEDPFHPKVQFPSYEACPLCRVQTAANLRFNMTEDSWVEDKVLQYLLRYYGQDFIFDDDIEGILQKPKEGTGQPEGRNSSSSCLPFATDWTPCSRTCDVGTSTRMTRKQSTDCQLQPEVRLCLVRPCATNFPDWRQSSWHVANCPRQGHTYRLARQLALSYGNCSMTTSETWKVCGRCPPIRAHPVCCRPAKSTTQSRDVTCVSRTPEGKLSTARGKMLVLVVEYCVCDENCAE